MKNGDIRTFFRTSNGQWLLLVVVFIFFGLNNLLYTFWSWIGAFVMGFVVWRVIDLIMGGHEELKQQNKFFVKKEKVENYTEAIIRLKEEIIEHKKEMELNVPLIQELLKGSHFKDEEDKAERAENRMRVQVRDTGQIGYIDKNKFDSLHFRELEVEDLNFNNELRRMEKSVRISAESSRSKL